MFRILNNLLGIIVCSVKSRKVAMNCWDAFLIKSYKLLKCSLMVIDKNFLCVAFLWIEFK